jgi:class 3 adenylate cyclase/tetratricopeptide (TPR) repeat protein
MAVTRKTVTVLFADVADSTALGERLDPEVLRSALSRWFHEARSVIEHHGGTVEKYIGDSVMAVFGIPQLHEDDAVRAVRAADELRGAVDRLNEQLEREHGVEFTIRVGINTGEVVTGDGGGTLVTGDAVNVAKRLEEAAGGGNIIVGDATHDLVRASAEFESLAPLEVKGKAASVVAWRLVSVDPTALPFERRFDTPFVGRERELEQLRRAFRRSVEERTCHLFTLLGGAGIGKTRLACELFDELTHEATVVTGRCLPYGDGITFWPLHDVINELGGEAHVLRLLSVNADAELICERLTGEPGSHELFWAVRRLCETLALERPLILCFEDLHWAEPTFLDLIEYLAGWIRDAPILLICLARPEFLDERPAWLSGQETAASLTLRPLTEAESEALLAALGTSDAGQRQRIAEAAEGNPLFAEQMAAMLAEGGRLETIPPTIQALLSARLDRLTPAERDVIERAAVAGKEFWRDAVVALSDSDGHGQIGSVLISLVRKELIRPNRSTTRPDDAFRFAHVLIRDAAYAAIPKEKRSVLHEEFASWLERESEGPELDEIVGYHLEQAFRARADLGRMDGRAHELAAHASTLLARAGRRALQRGDMPAARTLLERGAALLERDAPSRPEVLTELGAALAETGSQGKAQDVLAEAIALAEAAGNEPLAARARVERSSVVALVDRNIHADDLRAVAESAVAVFESEGNDAGLAKALSHLAEVHWMRCRYGEMEAVLERALIHAERANSGRELSWILGSLCRVAVVGPRRVPDGIRRCRSILERARGDTHLTAVVESSLAALEAMRGNRDEARTLYVRSFDALEELGFTVQLASLRMYAGMAELTCGDPARAEQMLRLGYDVLRRIGERSYLSTTAAFLAQALYEQELYEEAERLTVVSEEAASPDDLGSQVIWRGTRAKVQARRGEQSAIDLAEEAVALSERTDFLNMQAQACAALGDVLSLHDRLEDARRCLESAARLYDAKGNVASSDRTRQRADELEAASLA